MITVHLQRLWFITAFATEHHRHAGEGEAFCWYRDGSIIGGEMEA